MQDDSTHWTVIRRAAAGSAPDRDQFARCYGPVIRAYLGARWRHTPLFEDVDDAAQQVFLDCFKEGGALTRVDPERASGFRAYLYGVVRNVARAAERKFARSREKRGYSGVSPAAMASKEDGLAVVFDRAWATALLREAADLQLRRARARGARAIRRHHLLALRFGEGLPVRVIAERWQVAPAELHRDYAKAREEFKRALMDVVQEHQGGDPCGVEAECARLLHLFG